MSKLVDRERLARLAAALDARAKAAVKAEEERAMAAEEALSDAIDAINNGDNGILKQAKDYADQKDAAMKEALDQKDADLDAAIKKEAEDRDAADVALSGRVAANEAFVAAQPAIDAEQNRRLGVLEGNDEAHEERMGDIEDAADALEERVKANEDKLVVVQGNGDGSINKAKQDAMDYADQKITALVDSAPEAMNTLNELAAAIKDNKDVYDGYVAEHATAMANMKKELQDEIDADVKVVADEVAKQKDAAQDGTLANQIKVEKERAEGVEAGHNTRIAANEAFVAAQPGIDAAQDAKIKALEDKFAGDNSVANQIKAVADALDAHEEAAIEKNNDQDNKITAAQNAADAAQQAADKAQGEVDAVEGRMATAEDEIDALQDFVTDHDHSVMEKGIADNKAAIEQEIEDRNAAIAAALVPYAKSEDVMAALGNVVNSLALSMENNKMVLKLGGVDGVEIHSTSLDMATDADIDEIIAGLDAE